MRIPMIAGNWKMNTTLDEAVKLAEELVPSLDQVTGIDKVICPPFISLDAVRKVVAGSSIKTGAQNLYFKDKGAFTGEISPLMLSGLCEYVIIGHSERRLYFYETNEIISQKIAAAKKYNLKPILCVGETLEEYEAQRTEEVVTTQIYASLEGINQADDLIVAYEPVWAIGTGKAASGEQANATISLIRTLLKKKFGASAYENLRILYGGSVSADNIAEFVSQSEIDGALVGGASLKAPDFIRIVNNTSRIKKSASGEL
jgi:triosephosphate isomerase